MSSSAEILFYENQFDIKSSVTNSIATQSNINDLYVIASDDIWTSERVQVAQKEYNRKHVTCNK